MYKHTKQTTALEVCRLLFLTYYYNQIQAE